MHEESHHEVLASRPCPCHRVRQFLKWAMLCFQNTLFTMLKGWLYYICIEILLPICSNKSKVILNVCNFFIIAFMLK